MMHSPREETKQDSRQARTAIARPAADCHALAALAKWWQELRENALTAEVPRYHAQGWFSSRNHNRFMWFLTLIRLVRVRPEALTLHVANVEPSNLRG